MKTKEKIIEALDEKGITSVWKAIKYLNSIGLDAEKNDFKWKVSNHLGEVFLFKDDEELIDWTIKERDKIKNGIIKGDK